jgi:hypothetical protein
MQFDPDVTISEARRSADSTTLFLVLLLLLWVAFFVGAIVAGSVLIVRGEPFRKNPDESLLAPRKDKSALLRQPTCCICGIETADRL